MAKFIEVHKDGEPRLVNLDLVEDIWPTVNGAQIYFAFALPDCATQDFVTVDESYDELKRLVLGGGKHGSMGRRLIDADTLSGKIKEYGKAAVDAGNLSLDTVDATVEILRIIGNAPTVDAVPVVRCRECKHSYESISGRFCSMGPCVDCIVPEGFFCSYGERKED